MSMMKQRRFSIPDHADDKAEALAKRLGVRKESVFAAVLLWGLDILPDATIAAAVEHHGGFPHGSLAGRVSGRRGEGTGVRRA